MTQNILAVIVNWRRPQNLRPVVDAIRRLSVPLHLAIVECSPGTEFAAPPDCLADADTVFTISPTNTGPTARFLPPLALPEFTWTFFAVDDHVPGERCVEWMLKTFNQKDAASVGQDGRYVKGEGLSRRRVRMTDAATPVDVVTSSELIRTEYLHHALAFRSRLIETYGDGVSLFEDDIILNMGIANGIDAPCYLTPVPPTAAESWRAARLPAPHALSARLDHHKRRDLFVQQAFGIDWRSRCHA